MLDQLIESNRKAVLQHHGKTEEDFKNDIQYIKQWIDKQPHLPDIPEQQIRITLIRKKFSLEKTKDVLDTYYRLKHYIPEILSNWDTRNPEIQQTMDTCAWIPLPKLTPEFDAVSVAKLFNPDINKFNLWNTAKVALMLGVMRAQVEYNIREHLIFDMEGYSIAHVTKITPSFLKKLYTVVMKGSGFRVNAFHILYPPQMFDTILAMLKLIMKPKLYNRIKIHHNLESLYECIPKEVLPKEYGGNLKSITEYRDLWKKELETHREFLLDMDKCWSDESKRIDNKDDDIFGSMHGSFRTLQID